jgi:hypothetical protein
MRKLVASPLLAAHVSLPVTLSRAVIEAPALYSNKGVAVTLIDYSEESKHAPVRDVEVTVDVDKTVTRVESAQRGKLEFRQQERKVVFNLPLGDVDIVKLYY